MEELKIKTHTTYTYETADGREFDDPQEAQDWQQTLITLKSITMLNNNFKPTTAIDSAYCIHIKTWVQQEAFAAAQAYEGIGAYIPEPGYWYYDDCTDSYINAVKERDRLQSIIETLDALGK